MYGIFEEGRGGRVIPDNKESGSAPSGDVTIALRLHP